MSAKVNTVNTATNQPFNLPLEYTWILSISIPIIIAVCGWIIVYLLNNRHMAKEKKIIIKIQAFDNLKKSFTNTITAGSHFYSYLLIEKNNL